MAMTGNSKKRRLFVFLALKFAVAFSLLMKHEIRFGLFTWNTKPETNQLPKQAIKLCLDLALKMSLQKLNCIWYSTKENLFSYDLLQPLFSSAAQLEGNSLSIFHIKRRFIQHSLPHDDDDDDVEHNKCNFIAPPAAAAADVLWDKLDPSALILFNLLTELTDWTDWRTGWEGMAKLVDERGIH